MYILNHPSIFVVVGLLVGVVAGFFVRKRVVESHVENIKDQAKKLIENAIVEAEQLKKEALLQSKEAAYQVKTGRRGRASGRPSRTQGRAGPARQKT